MTVDEFYHTARRSESYERSRETKGTFVNKVSFMKYEKEVRL